MGAYADTCIDATPGVVPPGSISNAELANTAEATVKGRAVGAGTGAPTDLTGTQLGAIVRITSGSTGFTSGTFNDYAITDGVRLLDCGPSGADIVFTGFAYGGGNTNSWFWITKFGTNVAQRVIIRHQNAGSAAGNRVSCPGDIDYVMSDSSDGVLVAWVNTRLQIIAPSRFERIQALMAGVFTVYVPCPSGGAAGTADDVTVWSAAAPFALRILDATMRVSTAVALASSALRTASGGGGSVVLPDPAIATQTFSNATTGPHDDVAVATATVAAGGSLFLRRSDRSVVGELVLTCIRT